MKVRIHRGAHEIGGSCVEVENAAGERLVLDVGAPLDTANDEQVPLPEIPGLSTADPALKGVVISHSHQDHWGLIDQALPTVPLFMGEATHRMLSEAAFWIFGLTRRPAGFLTHREAFNLGGFTITPFLNDHSAFDAYSLLVEADGRRLFYTGDIRGHGRKSDIFEELLRKPPADIDVLLMEGTNIREESGSSDEEAALTEAELELECAALFRDTPGLVLAMYSAQNIDRLVTLYRAAKRSQRTLVMTLYGCSIASATGNPNIPTAGWAGIRVIVPGWQQAKVKQAGAFERVDSIRSTRIFEEELAAHPEQFVVSFSMAMAPRLTAHNCLTDAHLLWSMWPGYLAEDRSERLHRFLDEHGVPLSIRHTSGHASVTDLQRLADALGPTRVVPIHSLGGHRFDELFSGVEQQPDGEWWEVG